MSGIDSKVVSCLHFDKDFKDECGPIWAAVASPQISPIQSKFGANSLLLDGASYLSTHNSDAFNLGAHDFTVDWWEYRTNGNLTAAVLKSDNQDLWGIGGYSQGQAVSWLYSIANEPTAMQKVSMGPII